MSSLKAPQRFDCCHFGRRLHRKRHNKSVTETRVVVIVVFDEVTLLCNDNDLIRVGTTGVFKGDRYFDVVTEYAKASPDDILMKITVINRGPVSAPLHVLPQLWARNTWSWAASPRRPLLQLQPSAA